MTRKISKIIVHCSDTFADMDIGAVEIRRWHMDPPPKGRGWIDIGYNYVIRRDGKLEPGRDLDGDGDVLEEVGAHAYGHNGDSIGVCLVGGKGKDGKPEFNFTRKQMDTLDMVVDFIRANMPDIKVIGHRDVAQKACPSFDVLSYYGSAL